MKGNFADARQQLRWHRKRKTATIAACVTATWKWSVVAAASLLLAGQQIGLLAWWMMIESRERRLIHAHKSYFRSYLLRVLLPVSCKGSRSTLLAELDWFWQESNNCTMASQEWNYLELGNIRSTLIRQSIDVNLNNKIYDLYTSTILPWITKEGDDGQYGSSSVCDIQALQVDRLLGFGSHSDGTL
eukprot:757458-Hanusia_phi.AAC.4